MTDIRYPYLASLKDFEFVTTASLFQKSYFKEAAVKSTQQLVCIEYVHDNNYRSLRNKFEQLTKFQHPFILKVFGFYSPANEEESALVTPFCSCYSLDILQKTGNDMPKNNKYKIVFGICESMKYLEKLHMFHGDLKPSKILIDKNNNPIINFGKFYSQEQIEKDGPNAIAINYMAPEVISDQQYSIKSDVYSFAMLIIQIFTNKIPFSDCKTKNEIINKIRNKELPNLNKEDSNLYPILKICLDTDPNKRPSFDTIDQMIFNSLKQNTQKIVINYKEEINTQIECPIIFYRIPKTLISVSDVRNKNFNLLSKFNEVISSIPIDSYIILIIVFGSFQIGKSTLLLKITGNGAFLTGDGNTPTTQEFSIDGPYYYQYFKDRIPNELKREIKQQNKNPVIFVIDSPGNGDSTLDNELIILNRIHSIFCSLSAISIYVSNLNETSDVFDQSLQIIQQMKLTNDEFHKLFFLVRTDGKMVDEEILNDRTRENFLSAKENLKGNWFYSNKVFEKFSNNHVSIIPYCDMKNPEAFNFSIFNIIIDILNNSRPNTVDNLKQEFTKKIGLFISDKFDKIHRNFKKEDFPVGIRESEFFMRIYTLTRFFLTEIDESFENFKLNNTPIEEKNVQYLQILNSFIEVSSFIIKGNQKLSDWDYSQYFCEIIECVCQYLIDKEPNYKFALENNEISDTEIKVGTIAPVASGSALSITALFSYWANVQYSITVSSSSFHIFPFLGYTTSTVTAVAESAAYAILPCFLGAIGIAAIAGGCLWFSYSSENKKNYLKIREKNPILPFPFLWDKDEKVEDKSQILKIQNGIIVTKIKRINLIVAVENQSADGFLPMKFIIRSLTGIKCNYDINDFNEKEAILFGPFNPKDLVIRLSNYKPNFESEIKNKIYILYTKKCTYDPKRFPGVVAIMTSISYMNLNHFMNPFQNDQGIENHLFCFINKIDKYPINDKSYNELINETKQNIHADLNNINIWPLFMERKENLGPTTNRMLQISLSRIFKKKEKK